MLTCYLDDNGFARADAPEGKEMLGNYFVQDIQGDAEDCNELLALVNEIEEGKRDMWDGTGNAHTIMIRPSGITIENEWDESLGRCVVTINEFREAASDWLAFITNVRQE